MEKIRVLVAEDEDQLRGLFIRAFSKATDIDIYAARNGTEAIEMMDSHPYDAVISDLQMPGKNGAEVLTHAAMLGIKLLFLMSGSAVTASDAMNILADKKLPGTVPEQVIVILKNVDSIRGSVNLIRVSMAKILDPESR